MPPSRLTSKLMFSKSNVFGGALTGPPVAVPSTVPICSVIACWLGLDRLTEKSSGLPSVANALPIVTTGAVSLSMIKPVPVSALEPTVPRSTLLTANCMVSKAPSKTLSSLVATRRIAAVWPAAKVIRLPPGEGLNVAPPSKLTWNNVLSKSSGKANGAVPPVAVRSLAIISRSMTAVDALESVTAKSRKPPSVIAASPMVTLGASTIVPAPVSAVLPTVPLMTPVIPREKFSLPSTSMSVSESTRMMKLVVSAGIVTWPPTRFTNVAPASKLTSRLTASKSRPAVAEPLKVPNVSWIGVALAFDMVTAKSRGLPSIAWASPIVKSGAPSLSRIVPVPVSAKFPTVPATTLLTLSVRVSLPSKTVSSFVAMRTMPFCCPAPKVT